ncbi:hypothetical protein ES708_21337 [subsurface metagenome]
MSVILIYLRFGMSLIATITMREIIKIAAIDMTVLAILELLKI